MRSFYVGCVLLLSLIHPAVNAQSPQELGRLVTLAGKYEEQENYPEAIRAYEQSLMIARQLYGAKHANVAALTQAQTLLHVKLGQYDRARSLREKVVEISEAVQDADLLAEAVNNLATAEWELGRYARAVELHQYGLKMLTPRYGESSPQVAISRSNQIFTLGEIFGASDAVGSEILEMSTDNFRQSLFRARRDLYQFMHGQCGLVNPNNPCRCAKKTRGFIEAAHVDPDHLQFVPSHLQRINEAAEGVTRTIETTLDEQYAAIFRKQPFLEPKDQIGWLRQLLDNGKFGTSLQLN